MIYFVSPRLCSPPLCQTLNWMCPSWVSLNHVCLLSTCFVLCLQVWWMESAAIRWCNPSFEWNVFKPGLDSISIDWILTTTHLCHTSSPCGHVIMWSSPCGHLNWQQPHNWLSMLISSDNTILDLQIKPQPCEFVVFADNVLTPLLYENKCDPCQIHASHILLCSLLLAQGVRVTPIMQPP